MPFLPVQSYLNLGTETTRGTSVAPIATLPLTDPAWEPDLKWLADMGLRGSPVTDYDAVPGVRSDKFSGKTGVYVDTFPYLLRGILGSTDTCASVVAGASTHTIGVLNSASAGSQPPSYTLQSFDSYLGRLMTGSQLGELTIDFAADGEVEASFSYLTYIEADQAASVVNAASPSALHKIPGWNFAASVGGSSVAVMASGQIAIKRNPEAIFTGGNQGPYRAWATAIDVTGKLTYVIESGDATVSRATARNQLAHLLQFIDPSTSNALVQFQMSAVQYQNPKVTQSGKWLTVDTEFKALANATDAISGYAPIKTVTTNAVGALY